MVSLNKRGTWSSCFVFAPVSWMSPHLFFRGHDSFPVPQKLQPYTPSTAPPPKGAAGPGQFQAPSALAPSQWRVLALMSSNRRGFVHFKEPQEGNKPGSACPLSPFCLLISQSLFCNWILTKGICSLLIMSDRRRMSSKKMKCKFY